MACKLYFNIPGQTRSIEIPTDLERDQLADLADISHILVNSNKIKDIVNDVLNALILSKGKINSYNFGELIPNYTGDELVNMFPDEDWGKDVKIPDVILVNDNDNLLSNNLLFSTRIIQSQNDVWIVPKLNIKGFALLTKLNDILEGVRQGKIQLTDSLIGIHEKIKLDLKLLNKEIERIEKLIVLHRLKLIKDAMNALDNIPEKKRLLKVRELLEKANTNLLKHPNQVKYLQLVASYEAEIKNLEPKVKEISERLEREYLIVSKEDSDIDGFAAELRNIINEKLSNSEIPTFDTESKFLEHFITHQNFWSKKLSVSLFFDIKQSLRELLGWNYNNLTDDLFVLTIESMLEKANNEGLYKVSKLNLVRYFKERGITNENTLSIKDVISLLNIHYKDKATNFYIVYNSDSEDTVYFKRRYHTIAELYDFGSNTQILPSLELTYNGYFIFKFKDEKGLVKYFSSPKWVNRYTKAPTFTSIEDVYKSIDDNKDKASIYYGNTMSFNDILNDLDVVEVKASDYKIGDIVSSINYKRGSNKIPYRFTRGLFVQFVETTFSKEDANTILNSIDTIDKMALFYSYFAKTPSYYIFPKSYNAQRNNILKTVEEINQAPIEYYYINYTFSINTYKKDGTKSSKRYFVRASKVTDEHNITKIPTPKHKSYLIGLNSIAEVFTRHGIKTEVLSREDYMQKVGIDSAGWHEGGIIYLNASKANASTAFHEYSHLLIGILRVRSEEKYQKLLQALLDKNINPGIEDYLREIDLEYGQLELVKKLSDQERQIYYLEEIFANMYSRHLLSNTQQSIDDIFDQVDNEVVNSTIFDNLSVDELLKNAKKSFDIFSRFSTQVRTARRNFGFQLLDPSSQITVNTEKFINDNLSSSVEDGIVENCI